MGTEENREKIVETEKEVVTEAPSFPAPSTGPEGDAQNEEAQDEENEKEGE